MSVEVWWSSLAAADHGLITVLDVTERARVDSLERPADRGRSLVGAALLRVAVAAHLGIRPAQVVVDRTCTECGQPHGAPTIVGPGAPGPWVSVSHSGLLVVVAVSPHVPVGVDVQRESDMPDPRTVREWVRGEAELKARTAALVRRRSFSRPVAAEVDPVTAELSTPLPGYAAALTALGEPGGQHVHRHWGPPS
ncbi:hypothetical protein [Georgenia sp. SUBG003]|uniref:4'-phosphopantetheinyl transferase family protein n=1 Tax=Georgenia sp. SUBG003 TaxID=1497974 RepID=UPI0006939296